MLRAVVDTNVVVSGLLFGGLPYKIIRAALKRQFVWVTSAQLISETERVLSAPKFGLSNDEIQALTSPLFEIAEIVVPVTEVDVIQRCPADNRVLECALDGHCSVIVSGDRRDILSLKAFHGIRILNPRQFLELI